jgi:hypothetical protein
MEDTEGEAVIENKKELKLTVAVDVFLKRKRDTHTHTHLQMEFLQPVLMMLLKSQMWQYFMCPYTLEGEHRYL